ncbi:MAG TPA: carboxymuconolactone decarboxylase family protein [Streptosporangiaceae bacterium]|jgi:alkylhydroperoxidase family enzyme|nr:carboxymuconolactone decarboxylase family protein [Streptosporangiaceae bacterium]
MARISLDPPKTLGYRLGRWFSRRKYGAMLDPGAAIGHNMQVGRSYAIFEMQAERWHTLDRGLKDLAVTAAAARIRCAWCMDFGFWAATVGHAVPAAKIEAVPAWRDSDLFSELELLVVAYAEAMTATPPEVTDEIVAELGRHLSEAQLVELTAVIAVENLRSRINSALGLTAQGFADRGDPARAGSQAGAGP